MFVSERWNLLALFAKDLIPNYALIKVITFERVSRGSLARLLIAHARNPVRRIKGIPAFVQKVETFYC